MNTCHQCVISKCVDFSNLQKLSSLKKSQLSNRLISHLWWQLTLNIFGVCTMTTVTQSVFVPVPASSAHLSAAGTFLDAEMTVKDGSAPFLLFQESARIYFIIIYVTLSVLSAWNESLVLVQLRNGLITPSLHDTSCCFLLTCSGLIRIWLIRAKCLPMLTNQGNRC